MTKEELIALSDLNREDNIKYISSEAQGIAITLNSDRYAPTLCKLERAYICGRRKSEEQIAELEAQIEKMKWHKIADGDIPKVTGDYITNIGVLTYDHYGNNTYKWHTPFCEACDYGDEVDEDEVIAWCEIPKYTKEIKEK